MNYFPIKRQMVSVCIKQKDPTICCLQKIHFKNKGTYNLKVKGRRGADAEWAGPIPTWIKIWEGYLRSKEPQPHTMPPSPGFQCQENNFPQTSGCKNQWGLGRWRNSWSPKQFLLTHTQTYLLRITPTELQHWGGSLKGTCGVNGETEVSGMKLSRGHCPFAKPSPQTAGKLVPYQRLHQPG